MSCKSKPQKNNKPKVLKVIWSIPHYRAGIFRKLSQNPNMDFTVCAGTNPEGFQGEMIANAKQTNDAEGINWVEVKSRRIKFPIFNGYEWQSGIISYVIKNRPDAIITLGIMKSLTIWLLLIVCKILRIPVVDWTIGVMGPENKLKWSIRKFLVSTPKAHLFYGKWARDWYASHGFKNEQLFVVRNSLDYTKQIKIRESITEEDIKNVRREFGINNSDTKLLFHSGRLELKKKLPILFDALKVLKGKGKKIKLAVVGKGREEDKLKEDAINKGISDLVVFYGACYDENILGRLITASDLTVVTGVTGLIAMHSLVYGTPILTRYNTAYEHGPEVEAVVEGETGGYFIDADVDDLVKKIEYMLYENPCKPRMVQTCKNMIDENFNPSYQEKIVIQALNYVLPAEKQIPVPE